ncbi:MAG: error-prone DNA polymerase, partial [Pseudomonadales bacterium]|nr:error-prone DNA polymerase [Pseudomonadales bacterium]
ALLVYVSAWLKRHHPAAFYCGLLNSLPMGFYSPSQLVQDARRHDVPVLGVDVQESTWDHRLLRGTETAPGCLSAPGLRLGLRMVKGLSEAAGRRIESARPFRDPEDLARRAALDTRELRFLARAGALAALAGHRYQAHWEVAGIKPPVALEQPVEPGHPPDAVPQVAEPGPGIQLPAPTPADDMLDDYRYTSLTLGPHPMALLRDHPEVGGSRRAADLVACRHGQLVQVTGLVTGRQRPSSASGVMFVTLEDETGNTNVVVWTSVLERFRAALLQGQLLRIKGVVEREKEVIHLVSGHIEDVTRLLAELVPGPGQGPFRSRDFR